MRTVAVIGCGLIGRAWTISFLRGGCNVLLWDADPDAAAKVRKSLPKTLDELRDHGLFDEDTASALARLEAVQTLPEAVEPADYVQENTPETLDSKHSILARIDESARPSAIIASSTSGLLPSMIFEGLAGAERCLVAHPINPPFLVPAVEIAPGPNTSKAAVSETSNFMAAVGQTPIVLKREIDGFIMNRLQGALLDEAFRLVAEGIASAEDVDAGIRDGLGLRWSFMGPFETIDLNAPGGVSDYVARYGAMYERIADALPEHKAWDEKTVNDINAERRAALPVETLEDRQSWRDSRLIALAAHKRLMETKQ